MTAFRVGVFATIRDERGRVLLCHRTDCDWWNQPGGSLEGGETPWQGVVREAREECGLEVVVERLAGVYSWAPKKNEIIFSFVCRVTAVRWERAMRPTMWTTSRPMPSRPTRSRSM